MSFVCGERRSADPDAALSVLPLLRKQGMGIASFGLIGPGRCRGIMFEVLCSIFLIAQPERPGCNRQGRLWSIREEDRIVFNGLNAARLPSHAVGFIASRFEAHSDAGCTGGLVGGAVPSAADSRLSYSRPQPSCVAAVRQARSLFHAYLDYDLRDDRRVFSGGRIRNCFCGDHCCDSEATRCRHATAAGRTACAESGGRPPPAHLVRLWSISKNYYRFPRRFLPDRRQ